MKTAFGIGAAIFLLAAAAVAEEANPFPYRYRWTDASGYTYYTPADLYRYRGFRYGSRVSGYSPPGYWGAVPPAGFGYGYSYWGSPRSGYDLPPYGFGQPGYTGYNDPLLPTYGPGVQDFLRFGGADFYGW